MTKYTNSSALDLYYDDRYDKNFNEDISDGISAMIDMRNFL